MDTISSNLSKDGLLIISAPKIGQCTPSSRKIPIQTGPLDGAKTVPDEDNNSAPCYHLVGSKLIKPKFINY